MFESGGIIVRNPGGMTLTMVRGPSLTRIVLRIAEGFHPKKRRLLVNLRRMPGKKSGISFSHKLTAKFGASVESLYLFRDPVRRGLPD